MSAQIPSMPGYRLSEYMLVLAPPDALQERLKKIKEAVAQTINRKITMSKPYILLSRFVTWEMQEERLLQRLQVIGIEQYPFRVHIQGIKGFPAHTIYIPVLSREPVLKLVRSIRIHRKLMQSPDNDPYFISEPHMAIARQLTASQYETVLQSLGHRQFNAHFIADAMLLLRHRPNEGLQIVQRFEFQNIPVNARQGSLFSTPPHTRTGTIHT